MIVAGIDEAGYGPVLGPLVVGCTAFEVSDEPPVDCDEAGEPPCLWQRLRKCVSRKRSKGGRKLHVNDSKLVYAPAGGLKELERSVLALVAAWRDWSDGLELLLGHTSADALEHVRQYPWYRSYDGESFPLEQEAMSVRIFANALRLEMDRTHTRCVHVAARVVCERELNRMLEATRNKGSTLFSITATHLDYLLRTWGGKNLVIVCDRQGGRGYYGPLLRLMFDEWSMEIVNEEEACSEYRLFREGSGDPPVRIVFREKAEAQCLPVAYASMVSKYLREAMMTRFNAFWAGQLPGVAPTAGYHTDGTRFIADIDTKRREMGIPDDLLIRSR